jgi:hypothetical protein
VAVSFIGGGKHRPATSHEQTLSHGLVSRTPRRERDSNSQLYGRVTDCTGSFISNYHTITTARAVDPLKLLTCSDKYSTDNVCTIGLKISALLDKS